MSITLTVGATTINLPPDLYWSDEHDWNSVEQVVERSVTGALLIQSAEKLAGRPITLTGIDESSAWATRDTVMQLRNWAAVAGQVMTLILRGDTYQVMFRHQDGAAVEAAPIVHFNTVDGSDFYRMTVRLMVI